MLGNSNLISVNFKNRILQLTHVHKLIAKKDDKQFEVSICFVRLPISIHSSLAHEYLHPEELHYLDMVKHEKRKRSYLIGRCSSKKAFMALTGESDPKKVLIKPGVLGQPVITYDSNHNFQVSITHCDNLGAAIGFPEDLPMGIDIERDDPDKTAVLESQMTNEEKEEAKSYTYSYNSMLTIMWTVKESLSKILRTGLTTPFTLLEIGKFELETNHITSYFKYFGQYKAVSFSLGDHICSIVYPKNIELDLDVNALKQNINFADDI